MSDRSNPIQEWLARVAKECGTPEKMETWGLMMQNDNTKRLMVGFAREWRSRISVLHERYIEPLISGSRKA